VVIQIQRPNARIVRLLGMHVPRWRDDGDASQRALMAKPPQCAQTNARLSSGILKALGLGLPGCGSGVTDPTARDLTYARGDAFVVPPLTPARPFKGNSKTSGAIVRDGAPISTKPSPRPSRGSMACASLSNPAASPAGMMARFSRAPS